MYMTKLEACIFIICAAALVYMPIIAAYLFPHS